MKLHLLLILFATAVLNINQNRQSETPLDNICGKSEVKKCLSGGVLNRWVISVELPAYPQKAQEKQIEGTVKVQLIINEDGEVISSWPVSGPEELWAASVKAAVSTRFRPTEVSGKPTKVAGVLLVSFMNGKIDIPKSTGKPPVTVLGERP